MSNAHSQLQREVAEKLRKAVDEVMAEPNPFEHLLPPDRPPPGAPGQRPVPEEHSGGPADAIAGSAAA